jgi:phosphatidylinositol alpha-mannosyltransferase
VLFVGRAEKRKGLASLLLAMKQLGASEHEARLLVVGPLDRPMEAMRRRASELDIAATFLGRIPPAELPSYYQHADVCCFPATGGEAFGIVLGEAMAAGTPIVGAANPGYRGVVRSNDEGILVPLVGRGEAQSMAPGLADALDYVLGDRALAQRLSHAGRRRAADFDIETVGPRLLDLYDQARGGRQI